MKSCPPRASPLDERSSLFDDVAFGIRTEEEEEEEEDINNKSSCVVLDTPFLLGGVLLLLLLLRDAAAEEEKEEGGEGKQEQHQFIFRARLGFRPSVRLCPSVSVCVCVLLFFEAKSAVFLFFFLLGDTQKTR